LHATVATYILKATNDAVLPMDQNDGHSANVDGFGCPGLRDFGTRAGKNPGPAQAQLLLHLVPFLGPIGRIGQAAGHFDGAKDLVMSIWAEDPLDPLLCGF
jgi:hypothetical protein